MEGAIKPSYLLVLVLVGCAVQGPKLLARDEIECGQQATEFVKPRFPDARYDERGVPKLGGLGLDDAYYAWSVVADRCMKARGVY